MIKLKKILSNFEISQAEVARHCKISEAAFAQIVNHDIWPKITKRSEIEKKIIILLKARGIDHSNAFTTERNKISVKDIILEKEKPMFLRKQKISHAASQLFSLREDSFGELKSQQELWVSSSIIRAREHMLSAAMNGGFLAVIGESGSGKSSIRKEMETRIANDHHPITLAKPYMIAAEDTDTKGKVLKSNHIAESILSEIAPGEKLKASPEGKFRQLHKHLKESHKSGRHVCILIEEAHSLSIATIKHLKRLHEMETGYTKLLGIILIGQPELLDKLNERNPEVREVVQRCEVISIPPIEEKDIPNFINQRLIKFGKTTSDIIDQSGISAISKILVNKSGESQLYPLAINNLLIASINLAAHIGIPVVNEEIVKEVI